MGTIRFLCTALLALLCVTTKPVHAIPQYTPTVVGEGIYGLRMNNHGQVVGFTYPQGRDDQFFTASGGKLSYLAPARGMIDINDAGVMVYNGALHYPDGSVARLGPHLGTHGINIHGDVASRIEDVRKPGARRPTDYATLLRPDGSVSLLGWDEYLSFGWDVNDSGMVVGSTASMYGSSKQRPARFVGKEVTLLDTGGRNGGYARVVNNAGYAAGEAGGRAALWTLAGKLIDLGGMLIDKYGEQMGPDTSSVAYGINSHGEVVGVFGGYMGFLYSGGEVYDLPAISDLDAWGMDINDHHQILAQTLVGVSYILKPGGAGTAQPVPEPAPYAMFPAGLAAIAMLGRRKVRRERHGPGIGEPL